MRKIIVIQCAGSKTQTSWRWGDKQIIFVAHKNKYPASGLIPCEPDDTIPGTNNMVWREVFLDYYQTKKKPAVFQGADELLEAWQLYAPPVYRCLIKKYGEENVFILSAGWGLVNADYRLPPYNITFSTAKKTRKYARTNSKELWPKLEPLKYNPLSNIASETATVYFFGGEKYRGLLYHYTDHIPGAKVIWYRSKDEPKERGVNQGYTFTPYTPKDPDLRRNWQYECACRFINGELDP